MEPVDDRSKFFATKKLCYSCLKGVSKTRNTRKSKADVQDLLG